MALKDSFNQSGYEFYKTDDATLRVSTNYADFHYDFVMRLLTAKTSNGVSVQPFSQLDREMLIELREKLLELKGHPPELPAEQPALPPGHRKFTA